MLHRLERTQLIKSDLTTVWDFMKAPENLAKITPSYMGFDIITDLKGVDMHAGQIIEYKVSPLAGIKMAWVTEITHVSHKHFFVDEQRFGPYTFWHHLHVLKEVSGGIEMRDVVHYKLPMGPVGNLVNSLFVKKRLKQIFDYRFKKVDEIFNHKSS